MKYDGDSHYVFDSGRKVYAYDSIIGISSDGEVTEGYDGSFPELDGPLTFAEQMELADFMVARWKQWIINQTAEGGDA